MKGNMERIRRPDAKKAENEIANVQNLLKDSQRVISNYSTIDSTIRKDFELLGDECFHQALASFTVEQLAEVAPGIRLSALKEAGYRNVEQLSHLSYYDLEGIRGIGESTAGTITIAVKNIQESIRKSNQVRINPERRTNRSTSLVKSISLKRVATKCSQRVNTIYTDVQQDLTGLIEKAKPVTSSIRWLFASQESRSQAVESLESIHEFLNTNLHHELQSQTQKYWSYAEVRPDEIWTDFIEHSVEYYTILESIIGIKPNNESDRGFLPQSLIKKIETQPLNLSLLKSSLRGYQEFAAKYAIVQNRTLIGDEMGLGKTVEAIAAMSHIQTEGGRYFQVVCPASVLINWNREIVQHSDLKPYKIHGPDRRMQMGNWIKNGGVAVTTYETIKVLELSPNITLDMLVVDEAHYAKNPEAQRTKAIRKLAERAKSVLLLTGTPLENRINEMRNLIGFLQPELAKSLNAIDFIAGPELFRQSIAPVYLRRNREDVLRELPELIQMEEWVEFGPEEEMRYRDAVDRGNFMLMRRVAWTGESPKNSPKLNRLLEICQDAKENGRRIVIFSFFRDVISSVHRSLGADAYGPITGSVTPANRQQIIDDFSKASPGAALVCQVQAGGVGLNIQKASVVILCEPQIKPALETQAISRAYRMGQTNSVVVHRLLTQDSIDERMMEMLYNKQQIFDSYARDSVIAESSEQATDVTEKSLIDRIVAQEQKRLRSNGKSAQDSQEDISQGKNQSFVISEAVEDIQKMKPYFVNSRENVCPFCQAELLNNARFCISCGRLITEAEKPRTEILPTPMRNVTHQNISKPEKSEELSTEKRIKSSISILYETFFLLNLQASNYGVCEIDDEGHFCIVVEVSNANERKLSANLQVKANLYDKENDLIYSANTFLFHEEFIGIDTIKLYANDKYLADKTQRIKIFATKA